MKLLYSKQRTRLAEKATYPFILGFLQLHPGVQFQVLES